MRSCEMRSGSTVLSAHRLALPLRFSSVCQARFWSRFTLVSGSLLGCGALMLCGSLLGCGALILGGSLRRYGSLPVSARSEPSVLSHGLRLAQVDRFSSRSRLVSILRSTVRLGPLRSNASPLQRLRHAQKTNGYDYTSLPRNTVTPNESSSIVQIARRTFAAINTSSQRAQGRAKPRRPLFKTRAT